MRQMAGRRNLEKRVEKGADEMSAATDTFNAVLVLTRHDNPVTAFDIGPGRLQHGKRVIMKSRRAGHIPEGMCQPEYRVRRTDPLQHSAKAALVPVILGSTKALREDRDCRRGLSSLGSLAIGHVLAAIAAHPDVALFSMADEPFQHAQP